MNRQKILDDIAKQISLVNPKEVRIRPALVYSLTSKITSKSRIYLYGVPVIIDDSLTSDWLVISK